MNYFNLPSKRKKAENIEALIPVVLPEAITSSQQEKIHSFLNQCKECNCSGEAQHHDIYCKFFNSVDLADKIWYHGGVPMFMVNQWTSRLYFYII